MMSASSLGCGRRHDSPMLVSHFAIGSYGPADDLALGWLHSGFQPRQGAEDIVVGGDVDFCGFGEVFEAVGAVIAAACQQNAEKCQCEPFSRSFNDCPLTVICSYFLLASSVEPRPLQSNAGETRIHRRFTAGVARHSVGIVGFRSDCCVWPYLRVLLQRGDVIGVDLRALYRDVDKGSRSWAFFRGTRKYETDPERFLYRLVQGRVHNSPPRVSRPPIARQRPHPGVNRLASICWAEEPTAP